MSTQVSSSPAVRSDTRCFQGDLWPGLLRRSPPLRESPHCSDGRTPGMLACTSLSRHSGTRKEGTGCPRLSAEVTLSFTPSVDIFMSPCAMAWERLGQPCCKEWREPGQDQHHHARVALNTASRAEALLESWPRWMAIQGWVAKAHHHTFMWESVRGPRWSPLVRGGG